MVYFPKTAKSYITKIPSGVKTSEFPLTKFDVKKLEGFQVDLPVFEGVSMEDIAFITKNFDTLNLFRGCKLGCSHCSRDALAPIKNRETILYEDIRRFALGFRTLSERLGFDVLNGNKSIKIAEDSNPIDFKIKGQKKEHSVLEAMKFIYETLNIPTTFTTSVWSYKNSVSHKYSIDVVRNLVKMINRDKNSVSEVQILVNPFLQLKDYTDRIANMIFEFLDVFKLDKARIIYQHAKENVNGFDENSAKLMYEEIYNKLQNLAGSKLEGFPELKPEVITKRAKNHWIEPSGRGRKFYSEQKNLMLQKEFENDASNWQAMSEDERREALLNLSLKGIDIDGRVYAKKPSRASFVSTPIELVIPTNIKLNYINKEKPNPIFSDIEL